MNASLQASGDRHLAPADPNFPYRAIVSIEVDGCWRRYAVFESHAEGRAAEDAEDLALELAGELGVTDVHYYVGLVAAPVEEILTVDGSKWRVKAKSMKAALNEIAMARCTGSVGSSSSVDSRLCGGGVELQAEVHRLDADGNDVRPS